MNMYRNLTGVAAGICLIALLSMAHGATATLTPTADADMTTFGGAVVDTTSTTIEFIQSGRNIHNAVLEFNLTSIADGSTINSVSLAITLSRFVSNTVSNPAATDVFAFAGDAVVDIADYSGGTQVYDATTAYGGTGGDVRTFVLSDMTTFETLLVGNLLTLRLETDSFARVQFASLENTVFDAAALSVD